MKAPKHTIAELREILSYDPLTGHFTWIKRIARRIRVGQQAGCPNGQGYICIKIENHAYRANILAFAFTHDRWPVGDVDHENTERFDNREANLRELSRGSNNLNRKVAKGVTGIRGVTYYPRNQTNPYHASIFIDKKRTNLGYFPTAQEAGEAYDRFLIANCPDRVQTNKSLGLIK